MIARFQTWLYPELQHFAPGFIDQQRALWQASNRSMRHPHVWVKFVLVLAMGLLLLPASAILGYDYLFDLPFSSLIYALSVASVVGVIQREPIRREMRIELRYAGTPICIRCGYDLTSIDKALCPECGLDNYALSAEVNPPKS